MFHLTRLVQVQHIHFPVPVIGIRDVDDPPSSSEPTTESEAPSAAPDPAPEAPAAE